ncbi:MAG: hypothetical protein JWN24_4260 [Phycisphaerales bacterium]|nr:hypothetical protein [Phycisphaerales bacterium]
MNESFLPLSPEGERRKESILDAARCEAGRLRHRRRVRRAVVATVTIAMAASLAIRWQRGRSAVEIVHNGTIHPDRRPHDIGPVVQPSPRAIPVAHRPKEIAITVVKTEPDIARRLAVKPEPTGWKRINDDQLLAELAAAHRPAGLAYVDGREIVLFRTARK